MCKLGNIKQVAGDAAHDLADLGVVVIAEGKLLQMGEKIGAHIGFNARAHHVAFGLHVIVGRCVDDAQQHIQRAQAQNQACGQFTCHAQRAVGDAAHNQRQHQLAHGGQARGHQVDDEQLSVFVKIRNKAL